MNPDKDFTLHLILIPFNHFYSISNSSFFFLSFFYGTNLLIKSVICPVLCPILDILDLADISWWYHFPYKLPFISCTLVVKSNCSRFNLLCLIVSILCNELTSSQASRRLPFTYHRENSFLECLLLPQNLSWETPRSFIGFRLLPTQSHNSKCPAFSVAKINQWIQVYQSDLSII